MPRTDAAASLTAVCAASSQLFGDSARTSITLIRAMMVPPESVWAACPLSSTVHEENRCTVAGYSRCQRHGGACGPAGFQTAGYAIRIAPLRLRAIRQPVRRTHNGSD